MTTVPHPSTFNTQRILLRKFRSSDLPFLLKLMRDPDVMQFTGFEVPQTPEKIQSLLLQWSQCEETFPLGVWALQPINQAEAVGWIMLKYVEDPYPELGFMIARDFWNQGFATEAAMALVKNSFAMNISPIVIAKVNANNDRSIKVLRKIGMQANDLEQCAPSKNSLIFSISKH